jgi:HSP20 family protein
MKMAEEKRVEVTRKEGEPVQPERMEYEPTFTPQVDIIEKSDSVVVLADMPGVPKENLDVTLERGTLTINGEVEAPAESGLSVDRQEYEVGNFHRCFSVGEGLDPESVEASMDNGVLRLVIPKAERYRPRRIEIKGQ